MRRRELALALIKGAHDTASDEWPSCAYQMPPEPPPRKQLSVTKRIESLEEDLGEVEEKTSGTNIRDDRVQDVLVAIR